MSKYRGKGKGRGGGGGTQQDRRAPDLGNVSPAQPDPNNTNQIAPNNPSGSDQTIPGATNHLHNESASDLCGT